MSFPYYQCMRRFFYIKKIWKDLICWANGFWIGTSVLINLKDESGWDRFVVAAHRSRVFGVTSLNMGWVTRQNPVYLQLSCFWFVWWCFFFVLQTKLSIPQQKGSFLPSVYVSVKKLQAFSGFFQLPGFIKGSSDINSPPAYHLGLPPPPPLHAIVTRLRLRPHNSQA